MQAWLPQGDAFLKCFSSALWMEGSSSISALLSHSQTSGIQFSADGSCSTSWLPKGFLLLADRLLHFDKLLLQWRSLVNFEWGFSGNYHFSFPKWMYPFQRNGTAGWFSSYRYWSTAPEISVLPIRISSQSSCQSALEWNPILGIILHHSVVQAFKTSGELVEM